MAAELITGLGIFKSMLDMTKGLKDINDAVIRNAAAIELQERILSAQEAQSALVAQIRDLEKEVAELKAWDTEKQNYQLTAIGDEVYAFTLKVQTGSAEQSHKLCAHCFTDGHKSILQKEIRDPGRLRVYVCSRCKTDIWPSGGGKPSGQRPAAPSAVFGRVTRG